MNGKKYEKLTITCSTNEDWNGVWKRSDVEQEMREVGAFGAGAGAWEWVLNHVFDDETSFGPLGYDMLCEAIENGTIRSMDITVGKNMVCIKQS